MTRTRRAAIAVALAALCGQGCGVAMRPVRFDASQAGWTRLAGRWRVERVPR